MGCLGLPWVAMGCPGLPRELKAMGMLRFPNGRDEVHHQFTFFVCHGRIFHGGHCACYRQLCLTTYDPGLRPRPNTPGTHRAWNTPAPLHLQNTRLWLFGRVDLPWGASHMLPATLLDYALGLRPQPKTPGTHRSENTRTPGLSLYITISLCHYVI